MRFYLEVLTRDAGVLGFSYDTKKSEDSFPVFSRPVCAGWDLCVTLKNPQVLGMTRRNGVIGLRLDLRQCTLEGEPSAPVPGQTLIVLYSSMIPGFTHAYQSFASLDELELSVRAHLCLLGMMLAPLEDVARRHLPTS